MTLARLAQLVLPMLTLAVVACSGAGKRTAEAPTPTLPPPALESPAPRPTETAPIGLIPSATPEPAAEPTLDPTPTVPPPVEANAQSLVQAFIDAPYRVVAVAKSPLAPYTLIVANERSRPECGSPEDPQRCTTDETCGSFYTVSTCFFFLEPSFDVAAGPYTHYVARWPETPTLAGLVTDSFRFIDERTVEFRAAGGDGGYSVEEVWWLDLVTGALALQSRVENTTQIP